MGRLASYLQQEFARCCPAGWICRYEQRLLAPELEALLGYAPQADVVLERDDGSRRLWIEFEVSRADPVANHAKFATAHLFQQQPETDSFVAMVSPHVTRGRRNLAATTIALMRHLGMSAFQTVLFPELRPAEVQRLNQLDGLTLAREGPPVDGEIERALTISEGIGVQDGRRIHFAADLLEVMLNVRRWNAEIEEPDNARLWGGRTITYFVVDARAGLFAPSKFCAFVALLAERGTDQAISPFRIGAGMTISLYATLQGTTPLFDGGRAWTHLTRGLGMVIRAPDELPGLMPAFARWLGRQEGRILVHPNGPRFLLPPAWFR